MRLTNFTLQDWLKTYTYLTEPATDADAPLYPGAGKIFQIVDEPIVQWYYPAMLLRRLVEQSLAQQKEIDSLRARVKLLEQMCVEGDD